MEVVIGTIIGGLIAGIAMILNSNFNAKVAREKEERELKRKYFDKYISEIESIYEDTLHLLDKLIRGKGSASTTDLENYYRLEVQLRLKSTEKIYNGVRELRSEIANMSKNLPALPEEFVPKFEEDEYRRYRLGERKQAEKRRDKEAIKYSGKLYEMHKQISDDMKNHLANKQESMAFEKSS